MSNQPFDVITVGDVFQDIVMTGFPHWPQPGEEIHAQLLQREIGGGAAITACGLARLGLRTAVLTCVGESDSDWLRARLAACGVSTALLQIVPAQPTGLTVAVSTTQDRSYFTHRGANEHLANLLENPAIAQLLLQARHIHLALPIDPQLMVYLAVLCQDHADAKVSLDVGWQPEWLKQRKIRRPMLNINLFMPNEREAACMTGKTKPEQMLKAFSTMYLETVALKLGAAGAALTHHGQQYFAAPYPVTPVDTTGAGDCFDAGFIYGYLQEKSWEECLRIGNVCGALSTRALGGVNGFPTLAELQEALAS